MRRLFYLQHILFFEVNKQMSNLFLKTSHLFLSLLLHMGRAAGEGETENVGGQQGGEGGPEETM